MAKKLTSEEDGPKSIPNRDEEAVFLSHLNKLRAQDNKVAIAKAALDAERSVLNDLFAEAKKDKYSRKELRAILDDGKAVRRNLIDEEERRARLRTWAGLPAGAQPDLFDLGEAARGPVDAEAQGYAMGIQGLEPTCPEWISPVHEPDFLKGWHNAQSILLAKIGKAPANDDAAAPAADAA